MNPTTDWVSSSICETLSVNENDFNFESINAYPNPSNGIFKINSYETLNYQLYSMLGAELKNGRITPSENELDINALNSGIYLLKITNNKNQTKTIKLIKD